MVGGDESPNIDDARALHARAALRRRQAESVEETVAGRWLSSGQS